MELSPVFNAAAQGDSGETPADAGPGFTSPGGGEAASPDATAAFNTESSSSEAAQRQLLDMLERERAEPYLEDNCRPKPKVEQWVHTDIEFEREKLIAQVRAELEASEYEWDFEQGQDHDEGLELAW